MLLGLLFLIKKQKYQQTKGLNFKNKIGDDQKLCLLLEDVGNSKILNEITYKYRIKDDSLSRKQSLKCLYWNLIVYHEVCVRGGLNPEDYAYIFF